MQDYQSLSHTQWDCKYHVVFIPKKRKKLIFGAIRRHLGEVLHELAGQKDCKILEGHLMSDHIHMCISIPPKYPVANVVGTSRARAQSRLRGVSMAGAGTSGVRTSGPEGTSFQPLGWTRRWSEPTSGIKRRKMNITTN